MSGPRRLTFQHGAWLGYLFQAFFVFLVIQPFMAVRLIGIAGLFVSLMPFRFQKKVPGLIILSAALILPFLIENTSAAYLIRVLGLAGLYMIVALGLNVVIGFLGFLDLGFMAFYAVGAYSMALLSMAGWPFVPALLASAGISMFVRFLLGAPVLRLRGDYLAIVTLGFGEMTRIVINNWDSVTNGPKGLLLLTDPDLKPIKILYWNIASDKDFYFLILACVVIGIAVSVRLLQSRIGRAWVAIREDETAARLTGVKITRIKMVGFVASALFAGIAGGIFARWQNFVTPISFNFWESALLVTMVVIGGMGSIPGVLLGVGAVVLIPELLRDVLGVSFENWRMMLFGALLVVIAVYRPQGLWPSRTIKRELEPDRNSPPRTK